MQELNECVLPTANLIPASAMAQRIALLALLALLINTVAAVPLNKFYAPSAEEVAITEYIHGTYETGRSNMCNQIVFAEWGYNNDINNPAMKEAAVSIYLILIFYELKPFNPEIFDWYEWILTNYLLQLQAHLRSAEYNKNEWETHFKDVQWETFENPNIQNLVVEMDAALDSFNLVEVIIFFACVNDEIESICVFPQTFISSSLHKINF